MMTKTEPVAVTLSQFCEIMNIGKTSSYDLIRRGEIAKIKVGRRTLITMQSINAFVDRALIADTRTVKPS